MRRVALALLVVCAAHVARADSLADEADFRFHRAASLYARGRYEDALGEFLSSNRLVRNRNVIFNIARCFERLDHFNEAYRWYTEIASDDLPDADRRDLAAALERLRPSLALLHVESTPAGATVYVDRKDLGARGTTPVTLALPPGHAKLLVELPGYKPWSHTVQLAVGQTVEAMPELERIWGEVAVSGEPAGFDARLEGDAPLLLHQGRARVVPGRHVLTLSAPGHAAQQITVDVPAEGVAPVRFRLQPLPPPSGALVVRANLEGALVRVDGKEAGFTPGVIDNLPVGSYEVEVVADGREPARQRLEIRKGERSFLDVRLKYAQPRVVAAEKEQTTAQDAPASITVISADEIRGFGYTTLAEALQSVRGLYTSYDRSYATLGVRGFSSPGVYNSRVLVLSDGHVTNEASLGQGYIGHDFDADLSDVERIEVVRGPGSVLYGSAAFFAVVNVVHRTPATGMHGAAGATLGTLGENAGDVSVSAANERAYAWARASGIDQSGDLYFANPANSALTAQSLDGERAGHVDVRARAGDLSLLASYNSRRKLLPTGAYDTVFGAPGTVERDRRGFVELQFNHRFDSGAAVEGRAAYDAERYNGTWQYNNTAAGNLGTDSSAEDWASAELRLRLPRWLGNRLFVGAEAQDRFRINLNAYVPTQLDGTPATHFSNFADGLGKPDAVPDSELVFSGYLGDDITLGSRAQLDVAVRFDQYLDKWPGAAPAGAQPSAVNPRVALLVQPYDGGHTKVLFGRAFRLPGFYERFFNDGGVSQVAADNLRPETVYTAELEHAHQFTDEVSLLLSGYLSEMQDLIRIAAVPGRSDAVQYQNRPGNVHAAGGEVELRWQSAPGALFTFWYAYALVREDAGAWFAGTQLANSPAHTGALRVLQPIVPQTLSVSSELIYDGPRLSLADATTPARLIGEALYWNLGVSGEYGRSGLRYGAFVDNLLDQKPLLPAGPEINFPNHAVPQYGRTLRLQLAASF